MELNIKNLDLTVVKNKLMHHSGESWEKNRVELAEQEYKKFLHLCKKYPDMTIGLTKEADIFWHYHILNTQKYKTDCNEIFGEFMHHDPDMLEENMPIHKEAVNNYLTLYKQEFDLSKNEVMAHSARVLELKIPMAHSARAVGREEQAMDHSARAIGKEEQAMAHSARAIGKEEQAMAHSARAIGKEEQAMAHSARAIGREEQAMAHSARAIGRDELVNVEATNLEYQKQAA